MVPYTFIENDHVTVLPTAEKYFPLMRPPQAPVAARPGGARLRTAHPAHVHKKAIEYVRSRAEAAKRGEPFFLYLPLASPHTPIAPSTEWRARAG